ncbi:unnamed protein product [Rotaria sordida]|uniref:ABC transporter domain-containing protein n=1 Tax=Rotaria sordida TaxID=392033 RepID=A0A814VC74_9BILA|nr:unnamed protein product [Rotaria sordida]
MRNSMLIGSISFALINFPIQLLSALNGICTYIMPAVVFFFIRQTQSPELAQTYLTVIPLYSFLITVLSQFLLIMEPALVTITMGDHLWMMINHLEKLTKYHQKRIAYERESGIRQHNRDMLVIHHLDISVLHAVNAPLLQSDVNLEAAHGQCILISGPSGCGKTSLFRICAGLWPANAKQLILPERSHLIFIPQRPYLPRGSLRFQVLLLLKEHNHIIDQDIYQLFQVVNLLYLLQRYTLDTIIDWPTVLSVGEQQRLSFIRLLAFFTLTPNNDQLIRKTLVLFDEATSAIDVTTEHEIYARLIQLRVWFVTISHRSSLVHLHAKSLHFFSNKDRQQSIEQTQTECQVLTLNDGDDEKKLEENENNEIEAIDIKYCQIDSESRKNDDISNVNEKDISKWRLILNILKFIHLPFQANDKMLKLQTIVAWLLTLGVLGASTWSTYKFTKQTASLYSVLSDYGSGSISLVQAKESIKSNIVNYVILMVATPTLFSLTVGGGQLLATLYTRRQMVFLARLLLDRSFEEYENNLLYHSRHMTAVPNILSHDIAELNSQVFHFIFGHIYYTGIIGQIILAIILAVLLGQQNGGSIGVLIVYSFVLGVVRLSIVNTYLVNYGIPAAIFFHTWYSQGLADPTIANSFITLSVYMYNLFSSWNYINYFGDPLTHIQSIGIRIVGYVERLRQINEHHRRLAIDERERRRRQYIQSKLDEPSIILEHVDIRIPQSSHLLISDVNLRLSSSDNLIITGPSGCGKSTLLSLLAGLILNETNNDSVLRILPRQNTIFLCQQLYLIKGTLREQLSYLRKAHGLGPITDDIRAQQLLNELGLSHLIDCYLMDGEPQNWSQLLSIGEQQRLMMVTAFLVGTINAGHCIAAKNEYLTLEQNSGFFLASNRYRSSRRGIP